MIRLFEWVKLYLSTWPAPVLVPPLVHLLQRSLSRSRQWFLGCGHTHDQQLLMAQCLAGDEHVILQVRQQGHTVGTAGAQPAPLVTKQSGP